MQGGAFSCGSGRNTVCLLDVFSLWKDLPDEEGEGATSREEEESDGEGVAIYADCTSVEAG